jgi:hypothetical protein
MNWLETHSYIAAWLSPIITLVGLIVQNVVRPTTTVSWSMIIVYVVFLSCLATMITPGIDTVTRSSVTVIGTASFIVIIRDASGILRS